MADYTRRVLQLLISNGCRFIRHGKGDHNVWYSPIVNHNITVDGKIIKRTSANKTLKDAGINMKI